MIKVLDLVLLIFGFVLKCGVEMIVKLGLIFVVFFFDLGLINIFLVNKLCYVNLLMIVSFNIVFLLLLV